MIAIDPPVRSSRPDTRTVSLNKTVVIDYWQGRSAPLERSENQEAPSGLTVVAVARHAERWWRKALE